MLERLHMREGYVMHVVHILVMHFYCPGFPCVQQTPPTESDGPSGVLSLARTLSLLGKEVVILYDEHDEPVMKAGYETAGLMCRMIPFPLGSDAAKFLETEKPQVIVASERAGMSADGSYYTMKGRAMNGIGPVDALFQRAAEFGVKTIGIGDGGNELGMGKVASLVRASVPFGAKIACVVPADATIVCGVSNWGASGVGAVTAMLQAYAPEPLSKAKCVGALPTVGVEKAILTATFEGGCHDGVKPEARLSVDGMLFDPTHSDMYQGIVSTVMAQL
eukprot:m.206291 g.206291  ORF g.206291 m.206291 type:complete len:277 (-) comp15020_c1_seq3:166-996(-)